MIKTLNNAVRFGIYNETGLFVVDTDNPRTKPEYPYHSFKITQLPDVGRQEGAIYLEEDKEVKVFDSKAIISFNTYDDEGKVERCQEKALQAWEWFKWRGKDILSSQNIVVANMTNIQDRTLPYVDRIEHRLGFDVELRILHKIDREVDFIDEYDFKGGVSKW